MRIVFSNFCEGAAGLEPFLRGKDAEEGHFYGGGDADLLLLGFDFGEFGFGVEDFAAFAEFSGGDDGLLNEEALLASADGAATDFVAGVADGGIGVEAGLLLARFCGADFGFGLAERGIGFGGHFFYLIEGD